ncbi:MAG: hypothetical protein QOJ46_567 [bacterium]
MKLSREYPPDRDLAVTGPRARPLRERRSESSGVAREAVADLVGDVEGVELLGQVSVRHCEQSFRVAQMLAGEGNSAAQIATIMKMNPGNEPGHRTERVTAAATTSPLAPGS